MTTIIIDPVTRVEGHLRVDLDVTDGTIKSAKCSGTSFRGFEPILVGRDPREAPQITQRICGICPVPQARCACEAIETLAGITIPDQAVLLRNLILAANFIDSHLAHFYLMALPDYVAGMPTAGGWPRQVSPQPWKGGEQLDAKTVSQHVLDSIRIRRSCQRAISIIGGKAPHPVAVVPGGVTTVLLQNQPDTLYNLFAEIQEFVDGSYSQDVAATSQAFPAYETLGATGADLLSYGGFPLLDGSSVFYAGVVSAGAGSVATLDPTAITESVASASYAAASPVSPAAGDTKPVLDAAGGYRVSSYTWIKAPRLNGRPCEVGPLARAIISGRFTGSNWGVWARHRARQAEASYLCMMSLAWARLLYPLESAMTSFPNPGPTWGTATGLHEAPRGSLGHWLSIQNGAISRYNVIAPTTWNGSPRDDQGVAGPIEAALAGMAVADPNDPIEAMRVVHSFDPCLQCAVH